MRQGNVPPRRDQDGFTLVEVMVAALVLMIGVLGTFMMIDGANRTTRDNNARTAVNALAREILEHTRSLDYERVTPQTLLAELRAKPGLEGEIMDGKWTLRRRNIVLSITPAVCTYDDPMDGLGTPGPVNACPPGNTTARPTQADSNPDDFRRVTMAIEWRRGTTVNRIVQTSQLNNPGGGLGPRITSFPNPNTGAQITSGTAVNLTATSTLAATITWASDDGRTDGRGQVTGPSTSWAWTWPIGAVDVGVPRVDWVVDGVYTLNAQPFDSRGVPGEMRVASVLLNRRVPMAPAAFMGGRSVIQHGASLGDDVVELDWKPNIERDVLGYRVYAGATRVCPSSSSVSAVTTATSCIDRDPPDGNVTYRLVAVDRVNLANDSSATREGDVASLEVSADLGPKLEAPIGLLATTVDGKPQVTWIAPAGDVLFYRVYRDGERYARTGDNSTIFVDPNPTSTSHRYRISAVHNPSYREGKVSERVFWYG